MNESKSDIVRVEGVSHVYIKDLKEPGLIGSIKRLFAPRAEEVQALKEVSFSVTSGETIGLIGHNGAGKTTLLKILSGLMLPTRGSVRVLGQDPFKRAPQFLNSIALVAGNKQQLWWDLSALDSFELLRVIYGVEKARCSKVIDELVELLNVGHVVNVPLRKVSMGERMKLEIIGALLHSPKLLFLDEPTIGFDIVSRRDIEDFFASYSTSHECTIILTSHYMEDIERICNRIIWLDFGKKVFDGTKDQLAKLATNQKVLEIQVRNSVAAGAWERYGDAVAQSPYSASFAVAAGDVPALTARLMKDLDVVDIAIHSRPLSDIVHELFKRSRQDAELLKKAE